MNCANATGVPLSSTIARSTFTPIICMLAP
jgi:hypothetical protein